MWNVAYALAYVGSEKKWKKERTEKNNHPMEATTIRGLTIFHLRGRVSKTQSLHSNLGKIKTEKGKKKHSNLKIRTFCVENKIVKDEIKNSNVKNLSNSFNF